MHSTSSENWSLLMNILIVSLSKIDNRASYCFVAEFEEFLTTHYTVDVYTPSGLYPINRNFFRVAKYLSNSDTLAEKLAVYPSKFRPEKDYDLILCMATNPWQLQLLFGIHEWKAFGQIIACYIQEIWPSDLKDWRLLKEPFGVYDYLFTGIKCCTEQLQEIVDRPCHFVANAVDALNFSPYPEDHDRVIDVYSPGRRDPDYHKQSIEYSSRYGKFYVFDTSQNQTLFIDNHMQHRRQYINYLHRTRYSFAYPAKFNLPSQTLDIQEISARYYELTAAGCIVLGRVPDCDHFTTLFGWDDAVIPVDATENSLLETLAELDRDSKKRLTISNANTINSLTTNDWVYRWKSMLEIMGLQDNGEADSRIERLRAHALEISSCMMT